MICIEGPGPLISFDLGGEDADASIAFLILVVQRGPEMGKVELRVTQ